MTRAWSIAALALLVAGCSSGNNESLREVDRLRQVVAARVAGPQPVPQLTRARVDGAGIPLMLAELERREALASLIPVGVNGAVTTWTTGDGATLALRDGVVVASRGLAPDLMSAAVPSQADLRRGGEIVRSHYTLGLDDVTERADYSCTIAPAGGEVLEIVGRAYPTERFRESCSGDGQNFVNDYWVGRDGVMRQSRQWLGPDVGFLRLRRLDG
ncbi:MAG: YjbF family lipoprotein [Rhodobacteraceae bacterium]|nr:YjbF family lipoprotein [Paracoccaceae bacterium]